MRLTLLALSIVLAASLSAVPVITDINPQEGFSFAPTHVIIDGSGFGDGAVTVLIDEMPATVIDATPTRLHVRVNPPPAVDPNGQSADITVRVAGHGEVTLVNAFFFHELAQGSPQDYTQVLVPLTSAPIHGAHGSVWEAELRAFNASNAITLRMPGPEAQIIELPIDFAVTVEPRTTARVLLPRRDIGVDGHFLYVPNALVNAARMSLRVRDTSQNAASLGDEVPVVRADQGGQDLTIVDVPIDERYRSMLRIYAFTPEPMRVGVTVLPESGDTPYAKFDVVLHGILTTNFVPFPPHPAYLALDPIPPAARAAGGRVRIELTNYGANVSPPLANIWAFVSLTNNETNQVTIVTPK
ncbi:MAG: IPT/TIG domain-containing protein [Thermoanaerobaculia bacterium]